MLFNMIAKLYCKPVDLSGYICASHDGFLRVQMMMTTEVYMQFASSREFLAFSSFFSPRSPILLPFFGIPHSAILFVFFPCIFILSPWLPPPLLPLVVLRFVFESPHRVTDAPQIQVVELLVEHEGPLDELRRFLPVSETLGAVIADVLHGVCREDGATGTKDQHGGNFFHLKHGPQFPDTERHEQCFFK